MRHDRETIISKPEQIRKEDLLKRLPTSASSLRNYLEKDLFNKDGILRWNKFVMAHWRGRYRGTPACLSASEFLYLGTWVRRGIAQKQFLSSRSGESAPHIIIGTRKFYNFRWLRKYEPGYLRRMLRTVSQKDAADLPPVEPIMVDFEEEDFSFLGSYTSSVKAPIQKAAAAVASARIWIRKKSKKKKREAKRDKGDRDVVA